MANIALALKSEISRLARKELKSENGALKKAAAGHRSEIAALKRRVHDVELQLARLIKLANRAGSASTRASIEDEGDSHLRFSAKGLATHRARLGLSAADFGKLVGASGQSIYAWETGKSKPRKKHLPAIAAVRALGKRAALERLESASPIAE